MEDKDLKELLTQLSATNETLANTMKSIYETISSAKEEDQSFLRKIFRKTTKHVINTDSSIDRLISDMEKTKTALKLQTEEKVNMKVTSEDTADALIVVQAAYDAVERNMDAVTKSLQQLKTALQQSATEAKEEIASNQKDGKFSQIFQNVMNKLETSAKSITAQAHSFVADCARQSSEIYAKAHKGLMAFGGATHEAKRRLHNVWHALKGESFDTEKFQPKGVMKGLINFTAIQCNEMNKLARESQDKSTKLTRELYGYTADDYKDRDHDAMDDFLDAKAVENFMDAVESANLSEEEFKAFLLGKELEPEKNLIAIQMENKMKKLGIRKEDVVNGIGQKVAADENNATIDLSLVTEEDKAIAEIITVLGDAGLSFSDYLTYLENGLENMLEQKIEGTRPNTSVYNGLLRDYGEAFERVADITREHNLHRRDVERGYNRETEVPRKYYQDIAIALAAAKVASKILS